MNMRSLGMRRVWKQVNQGTVAGQSPTPSPPTQRSQPCHSNVCSANIADCPVRGDNCDSSSTVLCPHLRWLSPLADGQLFRGSCLKLAIAELLQLNYSMDIIPYLGMYGHHCPCDWCIDRRLKHREEEMKSGDRQAVISEGDNIQGAEPEEIMNVQVHEDNGDRRAEQGKTILSKSQARLRRRVLLKLHYRHSEKE